MRTEITLRTRLVILVIAAILPLFGLAVVKAVRDADAAVGRVNRNLERAVAMIAVSQDHVVESAKQMLTVVVNSSRLLEGRNQQCQAFFAALRSQLPLFSNIGIIDVDGQLRCDGLNSGRRFIGQANFFMTALAGHGLVSDDSASDLAGGKSGITFALSVQDGHDRATGVAFVSVDLDHLSRAVAGVPLPEGSHAVITDRAGVVLATSDPLRARLGRQVPVALLQEAVKYGRRGVSEGLDADGVKGIYAYASSGKSASLPFFVAVSMDKDEVLAPAKRQVAVAYTVLAALAFLGGWLAWVLGSRSIVRPTAAILDATRQIRNGRLDVRIALVPSSSGSELTRVAEGFNQMADALEQREQALATELTHSRQTGAALQRAAAAAQAITWHQGLEGLLDELADQARGVIGAHQAVVSRPLNGDWAQASHALSLSEKYAQYRDSMSPQDGVSIYAQVCDSRRAVRMTQAELAAHPLRASFLGFGQPSAEQPALRSWLAVPLIGRSGKSMGLLQLVDKYQGEFSQRDEYMAIELAQLAAMAIENAQLLQDVHQLNAGLEQKVAERTLALSRQESLFRALAEQAPQVVWTASPDGMLSYVNRAWFDLAGGEFHDWEGTKWFAAVHPEDLPAVRAAWQAAMAQRSPYMGIRRLLAKDGSYHTMSYRASPVLDASGGVAFWVGIDADISEIKSIEAALRLSNQELEAFSYSVSHDLRSPLNTIDGFSRLLSKQLAGEVDQKVQHYLSRIQAGVAHMGKLIEDLLSLAQVSRIALSHETLDFSALSQRVLDELQAREPGRQVQALVEPGLQVFGDARLLRVVMENLLGNAWKFTARQSTACIRVGHKVDAAGLPVFFVSDNGAGFDMAYADKLFVAFQRLHTVAEFPGTGIGLATVSRVIARHGGRLWATAEPGSGATFFFTLPATPLVA